MATTEQRGKLIDYLEAEIATKDAEMALLREALGAQLAPCPACEGRGDCDDRIAVAKAALNQRIARVALTKWVQGD